jgi:hypothetical protein
VKVIKQSVFGVPNVTEFKNVLTDLTKKSAQKLVMNGIYMPCLYVDGDKRYIYILVALILFRVHKFMPLCMYMLAE